MTAAQEWASNVCDAMADELNHAFSEEVAGPYITFASRQLQGALAQYADAPDDGA